jgi:cytoplasmic iron level regulating protein YaaA (DUF328/UPF0246 family)
MELQNLKKIKLHELGKLTSMEIQELRELKANILNKYQKTKDNDLQKLMRVLDEIIKRKVINERIRTGDYTAQKPSQPELTKTC